MHAGLKKILSCQKAQISSQQTVATGCTVNQALIIALGQTCRQTDVQRKVPETDIITEGQTWKTWQLSAWHGCLLYHWFKCSADMKYM